MYWDNLDYHEGGRCVESIWMSHPAIREEINRRISGSKGRWPLEWFAERFDSALPFESAVTIGCGTGALERDLVRKKIASRVTGLDIAPAPIERAREAAEAEGLTDRVSYELAEAHEYLDQRPEAFDAVFFHGSLHHFYRPVEILESSRRALKEKGLVYIDEYVGPSRTEWHPLRMLPANLAYYLLPRAARRPKIVRAPINYDDPTEAVASNEILSAIDRVFERVERRDYGGNLLSVVYPNLRRPLGERAAFDAAVRRLVRLENAFLRLPGVTSYSTVVIARKRA